MTRSLRSVLSIALTVLLAVMLIATIYLTLFELQWLAFLVGVLFAAVVALASQVSRSQWLLMRRTSQLRRIKQVLADETARHEGTVETLKATELIFQLIGDALPMMIVCVDREGRCRYHNRAFAQWRGRSRAQIEGEMLRDVLGDEICQEVNSHSAEILAGKEIRYQVQWPQLAGSGTEGFAVMLLPFPRSERPAGFYALIASRGGDALPAPLPAAQMVGAVDDATAGSQHNGDMFYLESISEQFTSGSEPRAQLVQALEQDQFMLYAQPIRPLSPTVPYPRCFEVLLRLQKEKQDLLPPGGFFPVAERYSLMGEIDRWVVRNLIKWCLVKQRGDPAWQMPLYCVNLAAASLRDPEFALYVCSELQRHEFPAANLCFEIGEPEIINYHDAVQAFMGKMRPLGCRFTLDAFGSTKVSFSPLANLTLDFLKIDGVIIQNTLTDPGNLAKIRAIATASQKLGIRTIAEWVESEDMAATLRKLGVDYVQGFGIGKLGPIAQVS